VLRAFKNLELLLCVNGLLWRRFRKTNMDDQDAKNAAETFPASDYERYIQLALNIGEQHTRSRAGFGAFRHFQSVCRSSIALALESGFFSDLNRRSGPFHLFDEELFFDFLMRKGHPRPNFRYFFEQALTNPSSFNPSCLWALFWAVAKAEHDFLLRYVPYWSHEERLTGHLVSQLLTRLEDFEPHWAALDSANQSSDTTHCRIHYVDTATASREAITGADLGLIIQAQLPRQQEYFKAARFQAKKVGKSGSARIDLDQAETLIAAKHYGYYLFYHPYASNEWSLPPTVSPATRFTLHVNDARENTPKQSGAATLGEKSIDISGGNFDFATFITFALADQASEHGALASTAEEAVRLLTTTRGLPNLSRIVAVTLGAQATEVDWDKLLVDYINRGDVQ
jgi:hypothetical protein